MLCSQLYSPCAYPIGVFSREARLCHRKRFFAIKGSDLEKTSCGDGASLLGPLNAAVNTDVIVIDLEWDLPKISGIDLLVNGAEIRIGTVFSRTRNVRQEHRLTLKRRPP